MSGNAGKGYDCLIDLLFDFEERLTSLKFKNFDSILSFTYVNNVPEHALLVIFIKVVPLVEILTNRSYL